MSGALAEISRGPQAEGCGLKSTDQPSFIMLTNCLATSNERKKHTHKMHGEFSVLTLFFSDFVRPKTPQIEVPTHIHVFYKILQNGKSF